MGLLTTTKGECVSLSTDEKSSCLGIMPVYYYSTSSNSDRAVMMVMLKPLPGLTIT